MPRRRSRRCRRTCRRTRGCFATGHAELGRRPELVPGTSSSSPRAIGSRPTRGCSAGAVEMDLSALTGESHAGAPHDVSRATPRCRCCRPRDLLFSGTDLHRGRGDRASSSPPACTPSSAGSPRSRSASGARRARWRPRSSVSPGSSPLVAVGMGVAFIPLGTLVAGLSLGRHLELRDRPARRQRAGGAAADDHARAGGRRPAARPPGRAGQTHLRRGDAGLDAASSAPTRPAR